MLHKSKLKGISTSRQTRSSPGHWSIVHPRANGIKSLSSPLYLTRSLWLMCSRLILTYLIPLRLLHGLLPSPALLALYPRLELLFTPFIAAIKSGNVREYDERLEWAQPRLVGMSSYLVVERAREGCLRMLFKKAWVLSIGSKGSQADGVIRWIASKKSTRIPVSTFRIALELHGVEADGEEVECMVANMIYRVSQAPQCSGEQADDANGQGFIKGYISHEKQTVVLGKNSPFPRLSDIPR